MTGETPLSQTREGRPASAGRPRVARRLLALVVAVAASGVLAYLLVGNPGVQAAPGTLRLEVGFDEWTIETDTLEAEAGLTTFVVSNDGVVDHELLIIRTDLAPGELPQGISGPIPRLAGKLVLGEPHQHVSTNDSYAVLNRPPDENTESHIPPGESRAYEVTLRPGSYVLYCNLPGHYQRGQYTALEVRAKKESPRA